jgi:hypothetical protein
MEINNIMNLNQLKEMCDEAYDKGYTAGVKEILSHFKALLDKFELDNKRIFNPESQENHD